MKPLFTALKAALLSLALSGFGLTVAGLPTSAIAAVVDTGHVKAELIVSGEAVPGGEVLVALRQTIAKDWHTYWRNPGDAGQATTLDELATQLKRGLATSGPYLIELVF